VTWYSGIVTHFSTVFIIMKFCFNRTFFDPLECILMILHCIWHTQWSDPWYCIIIKCYCCRKKLWLCQHWTRPEIYCPSWLAIRTFQRIKPGKLISSRTFWRESWCWTLQNALQSTKPWHTPLSRRRYEQLTFEIKGLKLLREVTNRLGSASSGKCC